MLVGFNVLLDDIVFPDGRTAMGVLGGGGPQAAFGMRLFSPVSAVGLVGMVGADFPQSARAWVKESGIDTAGLRQQDQRRTARAWQVTEEDGRRTQVWRVPPMASLAVESIPETYRASTNPAGFHFGIHPETPPLEFAAALRRAYPRAVVSVEAFRGVDAPLGPEALFRMLAMADIFSANGLEAGSLVGAGSPRGVLRRLVEAAESRAMLMVLRLGKDGSLVAEGQTGQCVQVPAFPVEAVDAVGAGNAYCGGFLAGWVQSHDIALAGACGAVAASFAIAQVGLPAVTLQLQAEAQRRLNTLRPQIDYTSL